MAKGSNTELDSLGNQFTGAGGMLDNVMGRMKIMGASGTTAHMCYLALFVVVMLLMVYYGLMRGSATAVPQPKME
jgi:hypothetical protein